MSAIQKLFFQYELNINFKKEKIIMWTNWNTTNVGHLSATLVLHALSPLASGVHWVASRIRVKVQSHTLPFIEERL